MMKGGLLKRVKAESLLSYAVQARRINLAFMVSMMQRKSWAYMMNLSGSATTSQLRFLTKRNPTETLTMFRNNLQQGNLHSCWAVLDSM
jgi:hypothetical protein